MPRQIQNAHTDAGIESPRHYSRVFFYSRVSLLFSAGLTVFIHSLINVIYCNCMEIQRSNREGQSFVRKFDSLLFGNRIIVQMRMIQLRLRCCTWEYETKSDDDFVVFTPNPNDTLYGHANIHSYDSNGTHLIN